MNTQQTTRGYLSVFPAIDGRGKWHAATMIDARNYCWDNRNMVLLDTEAAPIIADADSAPHPMVCKRCYGMWRGDLNRKAGA